MTGGSVAGTRRRPGSATLLLAAILLTPVAALGQASPYVPLGDPAYQDLDVLVARGWVTGLILGQRPYPRNTFARAAEQVRARLDGDRPLPLRLTEALDRLETRFARPVCPTGAGGPCPSTPPRASVALRGASADLAWAVSPPRAIPIQLTSGVDADVNPLLQRNQGLPLADGWTSAGEAWWDLALGNHLVGHLHPRALATRTWRTSSRAELDLVDGYLRAVMGNLSLEVGRNQVSRGHGLQAATTLSGNARALDMVRLSMDRPAHLPWLFRRLGAVSVSGTVADMGQDQDTPGSKLVILEGTLRPHPRLELGGTILNHQGGGVGPEVGLGERLRDVFFLLRRRPFYFFGSTQVSSDKALGLDVRFTTPDLGLDLYLEMLTTDDHDVFRSGKQALWNDAAWTGGARWSGLGDAGRLDLWLEASRVGLLPYTHHQFTSGMAVDRRILGSPLGPLGTGLLAGGSWHATGQTFALSGAVERYAGDTYVNPDDGLSHRFKAADNPDEIRVRLQGSWTRAPGVTGLRTTLHLGWEHVTRYAYTGPPRINALARLQLAYLW